jgi:hypothetical protein
VNKYRINIVNPVTPDGDPLHTEEFAARDDDSAAGKARPVVKRHAVASAGFEEWRFGELWRLSPDGLYADYVSLIEVD